MQLKIGKPNDRFEQEADLVADQVMGMRSPVPHLGQSMSSVQRLCAECEEKPATSRAEGGLAQRQPVEDEENLYRTKAPSREVQRRTQGERGKVLPTKWTAAPWTERVPGSSSHAGIGAGRPLAPELRAFFEPRFGFGFDNVRVHDDASAAASAESFGATAYTLGHDVVFGHGTYRPGTSDGRRLLAHELAHVVQQQGGGSRAAHQVQRQSPAAGHLCPIYDGYDTARNLASYNCLGLALRTYDRKPLSEARDAIADRFPLGVSIACPGSCNPGEIKIWFWEFTQRLEDEDGTRSGLRDRFGNAVPDQPWRDYHTVAGVADELGNDPQDVYSKDGNRPVYGPSTGPAFRPPDRQPATMNHPRETPGYTSDGKRLYWVRSDRLDECYCGGPCPSA